MRREEHGSRLTRRALLIGASSVVLLPGRAEASIARALSLSELLYESRLVIVGKAVDAYATWEQVGKRRCIVTYSLFHIDEPLDGRSPPAPEITIRTLGGTVGDLGQKFFGEAEVALNQRATVFVHDTAPALYVVTAMAQGHYPMLPDAQGVARLRARFSAVTITDLPDAAMRRLDGRTAVEAAALVAREMNGVTR